MPPSVLEWVAADHLVWTILDSVAELDLTGFYTAYRVDGRGRPAYDPEMMGWIQPSMGRPANHPRSARRSTPTRPASSARSTDARRSGGR
jgi:hypothetical protein